MSTEQKPATTPPTPPNASEAKQEPNALATGLASAWDTFKEGKLISHRVMALILIAIVVIGVAWWIIRERNKATSARWRELDGISTTTDLQKFSEQKENANTIQAKLARLEIARVHLGTEGIDRMFVKSTDFQGMGLAEGEKKARETRDAAVKSVELARDEFTKLVDEFQNDPVLKVECLLACAKAEAVLVGIPKAGQVTERRGDPKKAIEWLDKVAEAAPETDWGKDSKKLADVLRNQNTEQQVATLQARLFDVSAGLPGLPGGSQPPLPPGHP